MGSGGSFRLPMGSGGSLMGSGGSFLMGDILLADILLTTILLADLRISVELQRILSLLLGGLIVRVLAGLVRLYLLLAELLFKSLILVGSLEIVMLVLHLCINSPCRGENHAKHPKDEVDVEHLEDIADHGDTTKGHLGTPGVPPASVTNSAEMASHHTNLRHHRRRVRPHGRDPRNSGQWLQEPLLAWFQVVKHLLSDGKPRVHHLEAGLSDVEAGNVLQDSIGD